MQIHQIRKSDKIKRKKRVGRGGKRGTYSGKGIKGQKSRAGAKIKPQIREMILKFPKKRGSDFVSLRAKPVTVSLREIVQAFPQGGAIDPRKLVKAGLVKKTKGKTRPVKILGAVSLSQKYLVKGCAASAAVKDAIVKAQGKIDF